MTKRALITGITGQDGSYLAELLLAKGYEVHGIKRRSSSFNTDRVDHLYQDPHEKDVRFRLHFGDLSDATNLVSLLAEIRPDEVYNLGAQSHVAVSFETPEYTGDVDALGALRLLEAIRIAGLEKTCRYYQASSSELFGQVAETPQTERTPFHPRSPYAVAKLYAYWITVNYREAYGMYACNGILFNHESPRRGETFVTHKVTRAASRIAMGLQDTLYLGNLNASRDWGFAGDFVEGMWRMLQQERPQDYVLATGESFTVRELVKESFAIAGMDLEFRGHGLDEVAIDTDSGKTLVRVDPRYFRPAEVEMLLGNAAKAREELGWEPKVGFHELVGMMVESDMEQARREAHLVAGGFEMNPGRE